MCLQPVRIAQERTFLEPGAVMEVVRDDAGERHAEPSIVVARVRLRVGGRRHQRVLPRAPVARRLLAHGIVRMLQQLVVRGDEVAVARRFRHAGPEPLPCLGEVAADAVVEPVDLRTAASCRRRRAPSPSPDRDVAPRRRRRASMPQLLPNTSHRSMPRCSRSCSMSAIRCGVVFAARSVVRSLACGMLRPDPRWSNRTMR